MKGGLMEEKEVVVVLPVMLQRQAKAAALEGVTLRAWIAEALEEKLERSRSVVSA
jgi:predicted HicB family RNase H-like nuclease